MFWMSVTGLKSAIFIKNRDRVVNQFATLSKIIKKKHTSRDIFSKMNVYLHENADWIKV